MLMTLLAIVGLLAPPAPIHLEAEAGVPTGTVIAKQRAGFTGTGYVTGFIKNGDKITLIFDAPAGIYEAKIRYSAPGQKGYDMTVNGAKFSGMFPTTGDAFATKAAGRVELKAGKNTVTIERGWGYFDIDAVDFIPATASAALPLPARTPADKNATPAARHLLASLVKNFGKSGLSGQYGPPENDYVRQYSGQLPAIFGGDLIEYSPTRVAHGSKPEGTTESLIARAKAGQILTLTWHWNAPKDVLDAPYTDKNGKKVEAHWYSGFYTYSTTFNLETALANPHSEDYKLLLSDMDTIAVELKKLAAANIPVLWRPLHEAEGGWFWWGAKGAKPFVQLWRLMYDRFTNVHHLHNLLWVYTAGSNPDWYPGDAYTDILGVDAYPSDTSDPLSSTWEDLLGWSKGRKLIALSEFGGVPDIEKMRRFGVRWSYFVSWSGNEGPKKMTTENVKRIYNESAVINQNKLGSILR